MMIAITHGGTDQGSNLKANPKWDTSDIPNDMHVNGQVSVYVAVDDPVVPYLLSGCSRILSKAWRKSSYGLTGSSSDLLKSSVI
jgi:hypothetical protein